MKKEKEKLALEFLVGMRWHLAIRGIAVRISSGGSLSAIELDLTDGWQIS
jgi:hypothetical protein